MGRDPDRPVWRGQRPWFEIWFAVLLDASRRRALWVRQTMFVPRRGDARTTVWGAWFDADADPPAYAAKRYAPIDRAKIGEGDDLIRVDDCHMTHGTAAGSVEGLAWDIAWSGGRDAHADLPAWVPAPTHAAPIAYDADARGRVVVDGREVELRGRASAMHLWGKRRVPTLHWIWAPWLGDGALEVQAVSLQDRLSLGLATLRLDGPAGEAGEPASPASPAPGESTSLRLGPSTLRGRPATAAHPNCLVTATVAGARRLVHARAWAEPSQMVGYAYRDTDGRDLMVAQSDIGSAHLEVYTRAAPGAPWHPVDERRAAGGVAVEIHQHAALPDVDYIPWDAQRRAVLPGPEPTRGPDLVDWPEVTAIVALGLTYADHVRETGQKLTPNEPPTSFTKHVRAFAPGDGGVRVPDAGEVLAALDEVQAGLGAALRERVRIPPAVMDYEGELALVALGPIDEAALAAGAPQPFGLAAANDLTARICQVLGETTEQPLAYWTCAKSFPRFLPLAPRVWAPAGGLAAVPELKLETRVNGEVRQSASTKILIYDLAAIVRAAHAHLGRPLGRGDVVLTGTPAGVGLRLSPLKRKVAALVKDRFRKAELLVSTYATSTALLRPGDVIEVDAGPAGRVRTRLTL
jgi:2-keto-4-pentenoate hydratase/2-oxohepta-3-ene-1,7-dioic acid hydratase in catechol pathway